MKGFAAVCFLSLVLLSGCANDDGSPKTTKLVIENLYQPSVHSKDCRRGLDLRVTVKGRVYETGAVAANSDWDYELTQEKEPIPYTLEASCFSEDGSRSKAEMSGEIPAKSEAALLKGIVIGPPRIAQGDECQNKTSGAPCIQFQ